MVYYDFDNLIFINNTITQNINKKSFQKPATLALHSFYNLWSIYKNVNQK